MENFILKGTSNPEQRIEMLTLLFKKAEEKVHHSDTFRQRNMNYALAIFAGFIALGVKLDSYLTQCIISTTLSLLMFIFTVWDRRWHRTKHGWEGSSHIFYEKITEINNNPKDDIDFLNYYVQGEDEAEWFSWQPVVFYFLIIASLASFFIFIYT